MPKKLQSDLEKAFPYLKERRKTRLQKKQVRQVSFEAEKESLKKRSEATKKLFY